MVKSRESFERLIYKNSKNTFRTHSKTCSSISKLYSESFILMLKTQPKENYESKGKLKRDFSIATDFCILRNRCKNNRDKYRKTRDNKSNHNEEVFSVNECIEHGCGKSFSDIPKTRLNFDLTTLIIDNLKSLVSEWIRKQLLDNDDTKEKVDSIVNTILHRLDVKSNTSSCTYAIDVLVDPNLNDLSAMANTTKATIKHISSITSVLTLPLNEDHFNIMSTLSIPRHLMKQKPNKSASDRGKKDRAKEIEDMFKKRQPLEKHSKLSVRNEEVIHSYEEKEIEEEADSPLHVIRQQKEHVTVNKTEVNRLIYQEVSSPGQDMCYNCKGDLANIEYCNLKTNTNSLLNESDTNEYNIKANKKTNTHYIKPHWKANCREKRKKYTVNNNTKQKVMKHDIVKHIKELLDCVSFIKEINKVKLDISINVLPIAEKEQCYEKSLEHKEPLEKPDKKLPNNLEKSHINKSQQLFFTTKRDILNSTANIMSLLDSADSKRKLFASDNNIIDDNANYLKKLINRDFITTNGLEIATEIRELKEIVRSLAATAKEMLSAHLTAVGERYKEKKNTSSIEKKNVSQESTKERVYQKKTKSVQISESFSKSVTAPKIDINKVSKDSPSRFDTKIYKKSTSYRLFDSETILRVTDMTSRANMALIDKNSDTFETSTQKSGSSIDSVANRQKLYAFYCDSMKKEKEIYQRCIPPYCSSGVYYVLSQIKDSDIHNVVASKTHSGSSKRANLDVERTTERKKRCFDCASFRKITLSLFFCIPLILILSLVYLYLTGTFAFKPSATIFPTLTDKKPLNVTELGF